MLKIIVSFNLQNIDINCLADTYTFKENMEYLNSVNNEINLYL